MNTIESQHLIIGILIILLSIFTLRIINRLVFTKLYKIRKNKNPKSRLRKRINTIINIFNNLITTLGIISILFLITSNFINIGTLIASISILGLAISLGTQSIIKDAITGINFIFQDQFGIGDTVQIGSNIIGKITNITLTTVTIRDFDGNVIIFSNSGITQITNLSKDWSIANINISFKSDIKIDTAIEIAKNAGDLTRNDDVSKKFIIDETKILGIDNLDGDKTNLKVAIKTLPGKQFEVARIYRYHLKKIFEERGI